MAYYRDNSGRLVRDRNLGGSVLDPSERIGSDDLGGDLAPLAGSPGQSMLTPAAPKTMLGADYINIDQYAGDVRRRSMGGSVPQNPLRDVRSELDPTTGRRYYRSPFIGGEQTMTEDQWSDLQARMELIHAPLPGQQVKAFEQQFVAHAAGAGGIAPMPMESLMSNNNAAPDDVIRNNADIVNPGVMARYKADSSTIRERFAGARTRNGGKMMLEDVLDIGNNLSRDFPTHGGFIRDMLQSEIRQNSGLAKEYDQWLTQRAEKDLGSPLFRALAPAEQHKIRKWTQLADRGVVNKAMATELGYVEGDAANMGTPGQFGTIDDKGSFVRASPQQIAQDFRDMYGLKAEGEEGQPAAPQVVGMVEGPKGKQLMFSTGQALTTQPTNTADNAVNITEAVAALRKDGRPEALEAAAFYEQQFGMTTPAAPVAAPKAAPVSTTPTQQATQEGGGLIRRTADGRLTAYDPIADEWMDVEEEVRNAFGASTPGGRKVSDSIYKALVEIPGTSGINLLKAIGAGVGKFTSAAEEQGRDVRLGWKDILRNADKKWQQKNRTRPAKKE